MRRSTCHCLSFVGLFHINASKVEYAEPASGATAKNIFYEAGMRWWIIDKCPGAAPKAMSCVGGKSECECACTKI